jgi:chromosome segregation ATPase
MHTVMSVPQNATAIPGAMMDTWGWLDPNPHTLQDERPPDPFGAGPLSIGASAEASSGNAVSEYIQKLGQDLMDRFDRIEMQVEGMREIGEQNKNTVDQLNERVEELNKTVEQLHEGVRKLNKTAEQLNDVVEQSNKGMISRIESIERSFEDVMNR